MKLPPVLKTERLTIRPFRQTDLEPFLEFMLDRIVTEYLNFSKYHKTKKGAIELFHSVLKSYDSPQPIIALVIAAKDTDVFVGSCGLAPLENHTCECYYSLRPQFWRNGYATEAMSKLFEHAFRETELKEIRAYTSTANFRGSRVAERLGMKYMGITKYKETGLNGRLYIITNEDYFSRGSFVKNKE